MDDPFEVLGVPESASAEDIRRAYRDLVRRHHPDRFGNASPSERARVHKRMAAITAAYRMINDPRELERYRRLSRGRPNQRSSAEPGKDGVRFTAANPDSGGAVEYAPGDPDFDYRKRARVEFTVSDGRPPPPAWAMMPAPSRWRRWRRRT